MADFRKLVLVLAVLALVVPAYAQFNCSAQAGSTGAVSTLVRQEGLAELVGDILISCSGTANAPITLSLQIFLNTNVTSRNYGDNGPNSLTESLLLLDEPGSQGGPTPLLNANVFQGRLGTISNSLVWTNIPLVVVPGATTRLIRITNVRANASTIPSGVGLPGTIQALLTVSASQSLTLANAQVPVAAVLPGLRDVSLRKGDDSGGYSTATYQQCTGLNSSFAGDTTKTPDLTLQIRYRENLNTAFRVMGGPGQIVPGTPYLTESGLLVSGISGPPPAGQASQGTRLFARFANVPTGVRVWVTQVNANAATTGTDKIIANTAPLATLVGFDPSAGGTGTAITSPAGSPIKSPSSAVPGGISFNTAVTSSASGSIGLVEVPLTSGTGSAVWEVLAVNDNALDEFKFGVVVAIPSNITIAASPTPSATVAGGFAPISTVTTSNNAAAVPRFADTSSASNVFAVALCVTNLLFPYVTNQAGFDTGVAIINTSLDNATGSSGTPPNQPFKTTPQHGTCTVYYFGAMVSGAQLPPPQTTVDIAAGQMVAFAISQGGVPGTTTGSAAGFQGYMIVRCNFQYAHGFAFVSDLGANRLSHGYLALVIPDRTREASAFNLGDSVGGGKGEQLVN